MASESRKSYSGQFKLDVALAAIKADDVSVVSKNFNVAPNLVYTWKNCLIEKGGDIFEDNRKKDKQLEQNAKLVEELKEVKKERDFLAHVLAQ